MGARLSSPGGLSMEHGSGADPWQEPSTQALAAAVGTCTRPAQDQAS